MPPEPVQHRHDMTVLRPDKRYDAQDGEPEPKSGMPARMQAGAIVEPGQRNGDGAAAPQVADEDLRRQRHPQGEQDDGGNAGTDSQPW